MKIRKIFAIALACHALSGYAQQEITDEQFFSMSLEDLMNVEVSVATKKSTSIRETPAVITIIQREEIKNAGAHDLLGLLQIMAPGFDFGVDVEGVVGVGIRGVWAHEGKVLLMINGLEMNEEMFATTQFGNHFNTDNIERIEIIRGPGSAIYGGYASMGVINIITRNYENGGYVTSTGSMMTKSLSHLNFAAGGGVSLNDLKINVNASYNMGNRSQDKITDYAGTENSMLDSSSISSVFVDLTAKYKGLKYQGIVDNYEVNYIDLWGENFTDYVISEKFNTHISYLEYEAPIADNTKITPWMQYKYQEPWKVEIPEEEYTNTKFIEKWSGGLNSEMNLGSDLFMTAGVSFYNQRLYQPKGSRSPYESYFKDSSDYLQINNFSGFLQGIFKFSSFNFTFGGRYDYSDAFGGSFVPRFGITTASEKWHGKLMVAQAFRIPGGIIPDRIPVGADEISPEKATNFETEFGYKVTKNSWLTLNGFYTFFNDVIVYGTTSTGEGTYVNQGKLGTTGFEVEYRFAYEKFKGGISYSYYKPLHDTIYSYRVESNADFFLAFAKHKVNAFASCKLTNKIWLNANVRMLGERFSYIGTNIDGDILKKHPAQTIMNINLRFAKFLHEKMDFSAGVNNATNQKIEFLAPYQSGHGPLPGQGISFFAKLSINI
jgi:outer membrane receptor protein involved in Fe transport